MKCIYTKYGIEVFEEGKKNYLRYDAGEIVIKLRTIEISKEEAIEIQQQRSPQEMYEYMIEKLNDRI